MQNRSEVGLNREDREDREAFAVSVIFVVYFPITYMHRFSSIALTLFR